MSDDDLIGTTAACRLLGIGKSTLYRYADAGHLTPVQYVAGGKIRWRRTEIEGFRDRGGPSREQRTVSEAEKRRAQRRNLRRTA